jgi:PAS domain S-box-containing protein
MARQLDAAQAIAHVGSWEWDVESGVVTWSDELYRIYGLVPGQRPITLEAFLAALHPDDRERVRGEVGAAMQRGGRFAWVERVVRPNGEVRVLDTIGEVVMNEAGSPLTLIGTCRDITEETELAKTRQRAQRLQAGERQALELLAAGEPLEEVLAVIVELIEELSPETIASVLLLDDRGQHLKHGSAPHLPAEYNRVIDGAAIGPKAGSCGTAAYRREAVLVEDIETSGLWLLYKHLVRPYGLRACSSFPILSSDGRVLGTFAVYYKEPRVPDRSALELIERAAHVAGIAIERRQLDDQLRKLPGRIEEAREEERTNIAREIHDELGQALTALKLDIALVSRRLLKNGNGSAEEVRAKLDEMGLTTDEIISAVRRISAELRPGILDDLGLGAAFEWQAEEFTRRTGTPVTLKAEIGDMHLERDLATAVFRIFQEALTNVTRHAQATQVEVHLWLERGLLKLVVADDGVGVPEIAPRSSSLGLLGMRERARRCGGECTIRRRDPHGTIVAVSVPLKFPSEREEDRELGA